MPPFSPRSPPRAIKEPRLLIRSLAWALRLLAVILVLTTIYLFHLHHANHHSLEEVSSTNGYNNEQGAVTNSVDGSALRHKLELANFLIHKYDRAQIMVEGQREAMILGGYRGGNESDFIQIQENNILPNITTELEQSQTRSKTEENYNFTTPSKSQPIISTTKPSDEEDNLTDHTILVTTNMTWQQLQVELLVNELLPSPIPRERTARGFSGMHPDYTPALVGAKRGLIHCPDVIPEIEAVLSSMLAYWNDPIGVRDYHAGSTGSNSIEYNNSTTDGHSHVFIPPPLSREAAKNPRVSRRRYLTFEADTGGWNNLRISLENIIVLAAISGRTLVLPPDHLLYLLSPGKADSHKERNYNNYINFDTDIVRRVPILTAEQFLQLEGGEDGLAPLTQYNSTWQDHLWKVSRTCEERRLSNNFCEDLYDHYLKHGQLANITSEWPDEACFIFDESVFLHGEEAVPNLDPEMLYRMKKFCRDRKMIFYNQTMHEADIWHFETWQIHHRLLAHYYSMIFFTDPKVGNFYKRFVRDNLRYHDKIYCAAGKIILALQYENYVLSGNVGSRHSSLELDKELVGGYSSLHVRRGDLQFKEVKFDSEQWYQNTKEIWKPNEVLYVATDEKNTTFFDDFRSHHNGPLRYLDDYMQLAGLDQIDPTLYGMIDTIVASRGSVFAGTWFSTFSGYIIRLRGYYGMSKFFSYYSWLERKYYMHKWMDVGDIQSTYSREFPTGWTGIDGDVFIDNDSEGRESQYGNPISRAEMEKLKAKLAANWLDKKPVVSTIRNLARGISRHLTEQTPALIGARRGHIQDCDIDVDSLAYWNEPQGDRDINYVSHFRHNGPKPKYVVFSQDKGGFNNVRMSFEIICVICAALGRVLVLPPGQPMYLLKNDKTKRHHGLADFFDMERKRVQYLTMEEFVSVEGHALGQFPVPAETREYVLSAAASCSPGHTIAGWKGIGDPPCEFIHEYLMTYSVTPNITATHHQCLVFDKGMYENGIPQNPDSAREFCNSGNRQIVYVTKQMQEPSILYIQGGKPPTRMLGHFYGYIHFTDVAVGNYYKRYIRDLFHFRNEIFCASGKIIRYLEGEAKKQGFISDSENEGMYSSLHVRRGDFQYKKMRVSSRDWFNNTQDIWLPNEILYIATDESDKESFFEVFQKAGHKLYFLSDFYDLIGIDDIDPNWMGMIDTLVASKGRVFCGTYRSTFSGYINRLRGYYGLSMRNSYFGQSEQKFMMHEWRNVNLDTYAREWPDAWIGIDADVAPSHDIF